MADTPPNATIFRTEGEGRVEPTPHSADAERRAVQLVTDRFEHAKRFRGNFDDRWVSAWRRYRSKLDPTKIPWRSQLFIPITFSIVETMAARLLTSIFGPRPFFSALPREEGDVDQVPIIEALHQQQFESIRGFRRAYLWVKSGLIYGHSTVHLPWRYEKRATVQDIRLPILGTIVGSRVVEKTIHDHPDMIPQDVFEMYDDPRSTDIEEALYVIQRQVVDLEQIRRFGDRNVFLARNVRMIPDREDASYLDQEALKEERAQVTGGTSPEMTPDPHRVRVELLHYYEDDRLITVANRKFLLRDIPNPNGHKRKPFARIKIFPMPDELYSPGIPELLADLQDEVNDIRNQRRDNVALMLNRMWIVARAAGIDPDQLISSPGGIIWTDDMNGVREALFPDVTASGYNEEKIGIGDMERMIGSSEPFEGSLPEKGQLATGLVQAQGGAFNRLDLLRMLIDLDAVSEVLNQWYSMNQQFLPKKTIVRIAGKKGLEFKRISRDELRERNYDLIPVASAADPLGGIIKKGNDILEAYKVFEKEPFFNKKEAAKRILETRYGLRDADSILDGQTGAAPGGPAGPLESALTATAGMPVNPAVAAAAGLKPVPVSALGAPGG